MVWFRSSFSIFYLRGRVLTPIKSPILTRDFLLTLPNSRCLDERLTAMLILLKLRKYGGFTLAFSLEDPKNPWRIPRDFGMNFLHMIWSMLLFSWFCLYFLMDPSLGTVQLRAPTRQNNSGPRHLTKCSMPKRRSCQSCQSHGFLCFEGLWRPWKTGFAISRNVQHKRKKGWNTSIIWLTLKVKERWFRDDVCSKPLPKYIYI